MKENYGILSELSKVEKDNNYTVMQLLNSSLKNENGESNEEVRKRMKDCIFSIIKENTRKNIAIISHGGAIKFFMQEFCKYDSEKDCFFYKDENVFPRVLKSPSMLKIIITNDFNIKSISYEE